VIPAPQKRLEYDAALDGNRQAMTTAAVVEFPQAIRLFRGTVPSPAGRVFVDIMYQVIINVK